jgi:predicted Zn-dependent protease
MIGVRSTRRRTVMIDLRALRLKTRASELLALLLAVALAAGCATTGINKGQPNIVSTEEEVKLGEGIAKEVNEQFDVYTDEKVAAYVQRVGERVARMSDRPDIAYHFAVIEKDELNAFALPGGYIYIYSGLMQQLDDEAQLACVLAHEVGHVASRHATERLTMMYGYDVLASLILGNDPDSYTRLVSDIFASTGFLAYGRENEYEADMLGATYANNAGYDPEGLRELLEKLHDTGEREPSQLEELLSTHPPTSSRIQRADVFISSLSKSGNGMRNRAAYRNIKEQLP